MAVRGVVLGSLVVVAALDALVGSRVGFSAFYLVGVRTEVLDEHFGIEAVLQRS